MELTKELRGSSKGGNDLSHIAKMNESLGLGHALVGKLKFSCKQYE